MQCPKCHSLDFIKSGIINDKQRYRCNICKCQFTQSDKPGFPLYLKMHAVALFLSGISMNNVAQIFDVAPPTVMRWVNYFKKKLMDEFPQQKKSYKKIKLKDLIENASAEEDLYIDDYSKKVMIRCDNKKNSSQ